jgi:E3 ubiquitin-protein ligase RFWD2
MECKSESIGRYDNYSSKYLYDFLILSPTQFLGSVRFNPLNQNQLAFGSADHMVHTYDLRYTKTPILVLNGHGKAVSYVKWIGPDSIVSASTDCTLRLWNTKSRSDELTRVFTGHSNEKNFVGLSIDPTGDFIACGKCKDELKT